MKVEKYTIQVSSIGLERPSYNKVVYYLSQTQELTETYTPSFALSDTAIATAVSQLRHAAVSQTALVLYKEHTLSDNNIAQTDFISIGISCVPEEAILSFLIGENWGYKPSFYNPQITHMEEMLNPSIAILEKIAEHVATEIMHIVNSTNFDNFSEVSWLYEKLINQYSFYFIYDNINYDDAFAFLRFIFCYYNNNSYQVITDVGVLCRSIHFASYNTLYISSNGLLSNIMNNTTYNDISISFDIGNQRLNVPFPHSGVPPGNVDMALFYSSLYGIVKDSVNPPYFLALQNSSSTKLSSFGNPQLSYLFFHYYDYNDLPADRKILGYGGIIKEFVYDDSANAYLSNCYITAGGWVQYVPYLTGLFRFIVATKLGFRPMLLFTPKHPIPNVIKRALPSMEIKDNNQNLQTKIISSLDYNAILEYINNQQINYKDYIDRFMRYKIQIKINNDEPESEITIGNGRYTQNIFSVGLHDLSFLYRNNYILTYITNELSYNDIKKALSNGNMKAIQENELGFSANTGDDGIILLIDFFTDLEQEPAYLPSVCAIQKWLGGEEFCPPSFSNDRWPYYSIKGLPPLLVYNSSSMRNPPSYKRMSVYYDENNNILSNTSYKYIEYKDEYNGSGWASLTFSDFFNKEIIIDISDISKIYVVPVINIEKMYNNEDILYFTGFKFIKKQRLFNYPTIFDKNSFPPDDYDVIGSSLLSQKSLYYQEALLHKYQRYILITVLNQITVDIFHKQGNNSSLITQDFSYSARVVGAEKVSYNYNEFWAKIVETELSIASYILGNVKEVTINLTIVYGQNNV